MAIRCVPPLCRSAAVSPWTPWRGGSFPRLPAQILLPLSALSQLSSPAYFTAGMAPGAPREGIPRPLRVLLWTHVGEGAVFSGVKGVWLRKHTIY